MVEPDPGNDGKQYGRILIPHRDLNGAPFGMKVVCEIQNPHASTDEYYGKIVEVLGDPANSDVAMLSIVRQFGLSEGFTEAVRREAESIPAELTVSEIQDILRDGREDLRTLSTITIDGEDAKDLDDALSIEMISDRDYRLYVHIADVAHYVTENSALDAEARIRGTSVYLVNKVVPMLPPRLSNGICSLNPNLPRLAMTVEMEVDSDGQVTSGKIYESVIQSDARASYQGVQKILDGEKKEDDPSLFRLIHNIKELTDILIRKREKRGALDFSFPETHVRLDRDGNPLEVFAYPVYYSNRMIEECMILCNEFIARTFFEKDYPFIYRVHEDPNPEKMRSFLEVAKLFGQDIPVKGKVTPKSLSSFLERVKDDPSYPSLSQLLLRSLAKAEYNPVNLEHFGLASDCYCHFTSPIRRYPDLYIHRIIKSFPQMEKRGKKRLSDLVRHISRHCSETEKNAVDAERASIDQKTAEYMTAHVGEVFDGRISGIFHGGIFVRLESTIEGMIPFRTMDDFYSFDERTLSAKGKRSGKSYHIGDEVSVLVVRADTLTRKISFIFSDSTKKTRTTTGKIMKKRLKKGKKNLLPQKRRRKKRI